MSEHTPGPWYVSDLRGLGGPISVSCVTPDHISVADMGTGLENTEAEALANARLIAAAPRMYEYVKKRADIGDQEAKTILQEMRGVRRRVAAIRKETGG